MGMLERAKGDFSALSAASMEAADGEAPAMESAASLKARKELSMTLRLQFRKQLLVRAPPLRAC